NWKEALALLETWTVQRPKDANSRFWIAYCLERMGRMDEARGAALHACSLDPDDPRAAKLLARLEGLGPGGSSTEPTENDEHVPATEAGPDSPAPATETGRGGLTARITVPGSLLWQPGDVIDGRYEVREVRRGGMGEVYFVFDRALALDLAVKTPLPKTLATQSGRLRFLREAEAWIGLGLHVNICAAYYVRELGGVARLFIELIDGGGLDEWIKDNQSGTISQRLDLAVQVASGMHHAHTFGWIDDTGTEHRGLAHRDLKPANILVGSDGIARVTDFGLVGRGFATEEAAKAEADDLRGDLEPIDGIWKTMTLGGGVMGTPPYMPPEQWGGGHTAGKQADIYAFGCILFEMFCGRRPFVLSDSDRRARPEVQLAQLEEMHRHSKPPLPQSLNDRIDGDLAVLMLECLEKDPSERPPSFSELRRRLVDVFNRLTTLPYPRPNPKAGRLLGDALNNQGVSYATLGQPKRAEHAWEEALANDPRHVEATFNLAFFRWQSRGAGNPETLARMEEILRGDSPHWKARHLAGKLCLAVGDWAKALEHLKEAHRDSNGMPEVARDYAVALCSQGKSQDQIVNSQETVDILASCGGPLRFDPLLLTTYALAMRDLGQESKAAGLYKEARRHDPNLPPELQRGALHLIPAFSFVNRLVGFSGRVLNLALEPTGRTAATVLHDGAMCIWDTEKGEIERMLRPKNGRPRCLALSPDATRVLTTSEGNPVTIWDTETAVSDHRLQAHAGFLNALEITGDGRRVVGVGTTGRLNVWSLQNRSLINAHPVHSGFLTDLAVSADCKTAVTGGSGGKVLVVDLDDGEILTRPERHLLDVSAVSISQGGRMAISGDEGGE
ncbi:MAG: protein kinase, partial [Acidobacteriota bacterium]